MELGNGGFGDWGQGAYIQSLPKSAPLKYGTFDGGYNSAAARQQIPPNSSPYMLDLLVTRRRSLRRAPGATVAETFAGRNIQQLIVHTDLNYTSELLMFDPPYIGVKRELATVWTDEGILVRPEKFAWANYGGTLVLANGVGSVYSRKPKSPLVPEADIPQAVDLAVFAGRLFALGSNPAGNTEPMGIWWSGPNNFNDADLGSGYELLISDMAQGDRIVAGRTMGFALLAILCRHSLWVAALSGNPLRPGDFQPRVAGVGCVSRETAKATRRGVIFLSDEGVELFDSNNAVHISEQIDAELLPLSDADGYSATYNPFTQEYQLHTPDCTWAYDVQRGLWRKWSLIARSGAIFAQQYHEVTWGEMVGDWSGQGAAVWKDFSPVEDDVGLAWYLGATGTDPQIGPEDPAATSAFGVLIQPSWDLVPVDGEMLHSMMTIQGMNLEYSGDGVIQFWLPDQQGDLVLALTQDLDAASSVHDVWFGMSKTGKGAGARIAIASGDPELVRVELRVLPGGPRVQADPAVPGTYE